ncbi:MAG: glycosyltransferase, partial [Candidatus Eremiobacterota bacterium]
MSYNGTLLYHKFLFNRWIESKKILAQKAEQIIAISENTKKDIIDLYGIDKNKIKVIYLGNSLKTKAINISEYITLPDKYILFVGNRSGYKNFNTLIEAIIILLKNDKKLNIVCAGGGKFTSEEIKLFEQFNIQNRVHQYNVNDTILSYLYKNA